MITPAELKNIAILSINESFLRDTINKAAARIEALEGALAFYADQENWRFSGVYGASDGTRDHGARARAALTPSQVGKTDE